MADDDLDRDYAAFVADLENALDLDRGLQDATLGGIDQAITDDLAGALDLDAGLAAILPGDVPIPRVAPTSQAVDLVAAVERASAPDRLTLRPAVKELIDLVAGDLWIIIRRIQCRMRDLEPGADLDPQKVRALIDALRLHTHVGPLGQAYEEARQLQRELGRALAESYGTEHQQRPMSTEGLAERVISLRSLIDRAVEDAGRRPHQARTVIRKLAVRLGLLGAEESLDSDQISDMLNTTDFDRLSMAVTDLRGADLTAADIHDADLDGVDLDRVRWSDRTRWPLDWVSWVRQHSVAIGPGVYQIGGARSTDSAPSLVPA